MTRRALVVAALLPLVLAAGCRSFDPAEARREQTEAFRETLQNRLEALPERALSLEDCVRVALTNNAAVREADLNRVLAGLGQTAAFSAFLPRVAAGVGYTDRDYDNLLGMTSGGQLAFGPQEDTVGTLTVGLPVFAPSTWFLWAAARHGHAAAGIAADYVRQAIVLRTTAAYCDVLSQRDTVRALESQADAAAKLADRVGGLAAEGYAADWERGQADLQALARRTELDSARRRLRVLEADLLAAMGLPPEAEIELSGDCAGPQMPEGTVEELVLRALETHPRLAIADRLVVMNEHQVRRAFCAFLPTLSVRATHAWGGEGLVADAVGWSTGFQGAWTLFSGFANSAAYRAAKTGLRRTETEREEAFLSVIVGVLAAEAQVRDAREAVAVRRMAADVAAAKAADRADRAAEGLLPVSDALDARAEADFAQVALIRSRYQETVAVAALDLAMGIVRAPGDAEQTEPEPEGGAE